MYRRAVIAQTSNLEAFDAVCSWAESRAFGKRIIGTAHAGVGTVVLFPGSDGDDPAREMLLTELREERGVWAVKEVEYQG